MVEAKPSGATTALSDAAASTSNGPGGTQQARSGLVIHSNNFIHMNEGNIKTFYKISSCIGRGKSFLSPSIKSWPKHAAC